MSTTQIYTGRRCGNPRKCVETYRRAPNLNKAWLAAVDLPHRKATVTHVFQGATSLGGEVETLDCRSCIAEPAIRVDRLRRPLNRGVRQILPPGSPAFGSYTLDPEAMPA
ncbi:MAG: hypothetical protein HYU41_19980 [Candidatus Rokubacteria bacterium]|nr:hypothetical protein [Candidatus Rokubacteria bacterium]